MTRTFVALGGNLGDTRAILRQALAALAALPRTRLVAHSRF
jgi:7,8-dihydro-6-hydroxymethylpterin-pyrophosphokinase